jgi:L-2-hydroxyglutarate oxidase LhgO
MRLKLSYIKKLWSPIINNSKLNDEIQKNKINFEKRIQRINKRQLKEWKPNLIKK